MKEELKIQVHECSGWYICQDDGSIVKIDAWAKLPGNDAVMMVHALDMPMKGRNEWYCDFENSDKEPAIYESHEEAEQAQREEFDRCREYRAGEISEYAEVLKNIPTHCLHEAIDEAFPGCVFFMEYGARVYRNEQAELKIRRNGGLSLKIDGANVFIPLGSIDYYEYKGDMLRITTKSQKEYEYKDDGGFRYALDAVFKK